LRSHEAADGAARGRLDHEHDRAAGDEHEEPKNTHARKPVDMAGSTRDSANVTTRNATASVIETDE